jgi:hypothetical protein
MALTTTQVTAFCDSVAKVLADYNTAFVTNTGTNSPTATTITNGISGTGSTATLGRCLNWLDAASEESVLTKMQNTANSFVSYIGSIRAMTIPYQQFYSVLDAFDSLLSGLNAYLTTNSLQVNAYFAAAFNAYVSASVAGGYRQTAPAAIATANYFPYAAIDDMWDITCSGATTFSTNQAGTNASSSVSGGGVAQFYIYKVNATNASGGATFTITYTGTDGASHQATYSTTSGTPTASGSLAAGYAISGAIGSAITAVTGAGMTSAEQYRIGQQLVRSVAY